MRQRWLLVGILVATCVASWTITRIPRVTSQTGLSINGPGIVGLVILALAISGNRLAWAVCFVAAVFLAGIAAFLLLEEPADPSRWAIVGIEATVVLALWGLKPEDAPDTTA
jgi:hypothetical protein